VELRGDRYYVVDARSKMTFGIFKDRLQAMQIADKLSQTFHRFM
jgi:hypothetical protein